MQLNVCSGGFCGLTPLASRPDVDSTSGRSPRGFTVARRMTE